MTTQDQISELIKELPTMDRERLRILWKENFGKPAAQKLRRELMLPILAYRIQERAYGGLSKEIRTQLKQIARSLDPKSRQPNEARNRFKPGTRLIREWNGKTYEVKMTASGYEWDGTTYKSLSSIARKITGAHWSGPAFFGTRLRDMK